MALMVTPQVPGGSAASRNRWVSSSPRSSQRSSCSLSWCCPSWPSSRLHCSASRPAATLDAVPRTSRVKINVARCGQAIRVVGTTAVAHRLVGDAGSAGSHDAHARGHEEALHGCDDFRNAVWLALVVHVVRYQSNVRSKLAADRSRIVGSADWAGCARCVP